MTFVAPLRLADPTLNYIESVQPLHERFQQLLTQAAGYSLLVLTRGRRLVLLDGPVAMARGALCPLRSALETIRVPEGARHHRGHMIAAAAAIGRSLDLLTACLRPAADDHARTALTRTLRIATDHLRAATRLLPGFEMVDLSQACCAAHLGRPQLICQAATVEG